MVTLQQDVMSTIMKPEFLVSTHAATQFYQPLPPKWLKWKTHLPSKFEKPARESLRDLETLSEIRSNLGGFDTTQVDLLIDHKINLNAQFTPRNAFDDSEECQLGRLWRLTEVRKRLEGTGYALGNLDAVLKLSLENLMMATGVSRAHSFLTAHIPILSFRTESFTIRSTSPDTSTSLFFDDRTRQIHVYQDGKQSYWEGNEIKLALLDIWKATWAEKSAQVCFHLFNAHDLLYESCMVEMKAAGDAQGFLHKMSGITSFKTCRVESEEMSKLFARGPKCVKLPE
ncbi:MAG: hypothetical protein L6R36_009076 [Xanthoria steineri]|nr:MAG: hypothetical protein L6R36_009076 [Xanthoria steineri]